MTTITLGPCTMTFERNGVQVGPAYKTGPVTITVVKESKTSNALNSKTPS